MCVCVNADQNAPSPCPHMCVSRLLLGSGHLCVPSVCVCSPPPHPPHSSRYNVSSGRAPSVLARFDVKEEDFNFLLTCGFWTYAFTAPLTGSIADRIGGRNAVLVASSGCAVSNLVAGCWLYLGHPIFPVLPIVRARAYATYTSPTITLARAAHLLALALFPFLQRSHTFTRARLLPLPLILAHARRSTAST